MESATFRSRLALLIQKCRKAVRLYTSMGRRHGGEGLDYTEQQLKIWRELNIELLKELTDICSISDLRTIVTEVYSLRDLFYSRWRKVERELHLKQKELISSSEKGDFIKAAGLSSKLVTLKAQSQAYQAALNELQELAGKSKVTHQSERADSSEHTDDSPLLAQAKILPLRRKSS